MVEGVNRHITGMVIITAAGMGVGTVGVIESCPASYCYESGHGLNQAGTEG